MVRYDLIPEPFRSICDRWAKHLQQINDRNSRMHYIKQELPGLLEKKTIFYEILEKLCAGNPYPDIRYAGVFDNELMLYIDKSRRFSIRMYIYNPSEYTWIHDHNSWGVIGTPFGSLEVIEYDRLDNGEKESQAKLIIAKRTILNPGEVEITLPLNDGIHQTGNPTSKTIIMICVYGTPLRRLYIQRYDDKAQTVCKVYPPRIHRKRIAKMALDSFPQSK